MKIDKRFTVGMILGLLIIVILACSNTATAPVKEKRYTWIEVQDGCEYVLAKYGYDSMAITHHAACNNLIHKK